MSGSGYSAAIQACRLNKHTEPVIPMLPSQNISLNDNRDNGINSTAWAPHKMSGMSRAAYYSLLKEAREGRIITSDGELFSDPSHDVETEAEACPGKQVRHKRIVL